MSTRIVIDAEGVIVTCPYCEYEFEELMVHRAYEMSQECIECFESFQVQILAVPGG